MVKKKTAKATAKASKSKANTKLKRDMEILEEILSAYPEEAREAWIKLLASMAGIDVPDLDDDEELDEPEVFESDDDDEDEFDLDDDLDDDEDDEYDEDGEDDLELDEEELDDDDEDDGDLDDDLSFDDEDEEEEEKPSKKKRAAKKKPVKKKAEPEEDDEDEDDEESFVPSEYLADTAVASFVKMSKKDSELKASIKGMDDDEVADYFLEYYECDSGSAAKDDLANYLSEYSLAAQSRVKIGELRAVTALCEHFYLEVSSNSSKQIERLVKKLGGEINYGKISKEEKKVEVAATAYAQSKSLSLFSDFVKLA